VKQAIQVTKQLLNTVHALHTNYSISHRDIHPANIILLLSPHPDAHEVKLIDFNVAKEFGLKNGKNLLLMTKTGNARYRAPELFDTTLDHYSASVDVRLHNSSFGAFLPVSTLCFLDLTYFLKKSKFF
jgi:serine/threonine protein kinase